MRRWERLRSMGSRARATRSGRLTIRIAVALAGAIVVGVGLLLIPLPGPGWLIVLAGLAIWSLEFAWAQRLLAFTRNRLERWWHWLGRQQWWVRALAGLVGLGFALTMIWLSWSYGGVLLAG